MEHWVLSCLNETEDSSSKFTILIPILRNAPIFSTTEQLYEHGMELEYESMKSTIIIVMI